MILKNKKNNYWLFLKKTYEERAYKGTDDYQYELGKTYSYDSYVQNSKNIEIDDFVIFREDDYILGYGYINRIDASPGFKKMKRCPRCNSSSLSERKTLKPRWRCNNPRNKECKFEFNDPSITSDSVSIFKCYIRDYTEFQETISVGEVKSCSATKYGKSVQCALMRLDFNKLSSLLMDIN
jgi:hypothetical protein